MHENTTLVIENHYLGSILEKNQFDTFYHEHPRTYSLKSFIEISKRLKRDLSQISFPKRYGGNIRVFISSKKPSINTSNLIKEVSQIEKNLKFKFNEMSQFIKNWKISKRDQILKIVKKNNGPIFAKAFPGRAAILINILELDEKHIKGVYEKPGSKKIGHFVPGTQIPIISDNELFSNIKDHKFILNLAWHIPNEIKSYLIAKGYNGQLINII